MNDAEDGTVGSDTKSDRRKEDAGKEREFHQLPQTVANVIGEIVKHANAQGVSTLFLITFYGSEIASSGFESVLRRQTAPQVGLFFHLEMDPYLFVHIFFETRPAGETLQVRQQSVNPGHGYHS